MRNAHPAFAGKMEVDVPADHQIAIRWRLDQHWIKLLADLSVPSAFITGTSPTGEFRHKVVSDAAAGGIQSQEALS